MTQEPGPVMLLREAADALGVHYQTAYAWVREGRLPARKVSRGYEVADADVQALAAQRMLGSEPRKLLRVRDWPAQADQLHAAILAGDETRALKWIGRFSDGVPVIELCERVIAPALRRIGSDWESGQISIAQEHRASAICERLLATRARQPSGRPRGTVVVSTPPGERHGLPSLMAAACLRADRWHVHHLGADLPLADTISLARQADADLVVFSCTVVEVPDPSTRTQLPAILSGGPGDSLFRLVQQARDCIASH
jgi:MerR family transcriptional regulator, light-induced transcriptional regulator